MAAALVGEGKGCLSSLRRQKKKFYAPAFVSSVSFSFIPEPPCVRER